MASLNERMFAEFEDLEEGQDSQEQQIDDDDFEIEPMDASAMTVHDIRQELERRGMGLQIKGFHQEDSRTLQAEFDKEHESFVEAKRKERHEAKQLAFKQAGLQKRRMLMESQIQEEQFEIEKDVRLEFWLQMVQNNTAPKISRINLNAITSRSISKALWNNTSIMSLDVSRMGLNDLAGAYLGRALRNNKTLSKLDMDSNNFGPKTCISLADSLEANTTVAHINLESNLLSKTDSRGHDLSGIAALSKMLTVNKTLKTLSLWRCNIGSEGGQIMLNGMSRNSTILYLELGNNGLSQAHQNFISGRLDENQQLAIEAKELKQLQQSKQDENDRILMLERKQKEKEEDLARWEKEQQVLRAAKRRKEMENEIKKRMEEEAKARAREEERLKAEAEEAAKKAAKKAKKKKK